MSIANVSNRWLNRLYKILAIMLVLLAVMISAFRLFLPYVHHYKQNLENHINQNYQTNIVIGDISMRWQRWGPALMASQVTLLDNDDVYMYIEQMEVHVDFWQSLTQQTLISSNLILDGAVLELEQGVFFGGEDSEPTKQAVQQQGDDNAHQITDIFLNRIKRFSLKNSKVIVNDAFERTFRISNLNWLNSGSRHQAQGSIIVNELSSNNLSLQVDITGDTFDELKGLMYLEANHLDITPWLDGLLALDNDKTKADVGFSAWITLNNGLLEKLQFVLHDNEISWQEKGEQHHLALSAGQLLLLKGETPSSFKFFSTPLSVQLNEQKRQEYIFQIHNSPKDVSVYLSSFDLALVSQLSPLFILDESNSQLLAELAIKGQVNDVYFKISSNEVMALASFTDVSTQFSQGIPGIEHVSGQLSFTQNNLHVALTAEQGALDFRHHFVAPITYQTFAANVDFSFAKQGWQLQVSDIDFISEELALTADLMVDAPVDKETTMSLLASITRGDVSQAGHYFPLTTMSSDLVAYLNNALIEGQLTQAQVLLNGPLASFPYADQSGVFVVDAELENAVFQFDDEWPAITNFSANLNFTNNSMLITGRKGSLVGLDVDGVQAAIDDFGEQILTVDTLITPSPASVVAELMAQSPLKNSVGSVLEQLQVSGEINGEFHLNLPLKNTKQVLASGLINFIDNKVALQQPRMSFNQVSGQLSFINDKISTKNLSLLWQGLPLQLSIEGLNKADYYGTDIKLTADWLANKWQQHLPDNLSKYFAGQLQWQGELSLHQHHNDGFSYQLNINSDLQQTQLKLPKPYRKNQGQSSPLNIEVIGQLNQSTINATYADQLSFFGVLEHQTSHFSRAHLMLGKEKMLLPMDGFHITSQLGAVSFDDWQPLISDIIDSVQNPPKQVNTKTAKDYPGLFSKPERIRGTLASLELFGQTLNNVSFNLLNKPHWWLLQLNATETRSQIKLYPDWQGQGIDINADFIHITTGITEEEIVKGEVEDAEEASIDEQDIFANMPRIKLHCDRCQFDQLDLGQVDFSLTRTSKDIIKIDHFTAKRAQAEFDFTGQWQRKDKQTFTDISGHLTLKDIEYELDQLGFGSLIRDSGGKLDFDLNWQGGLQDFSFSHLNGDISAKIDDGYLAEVSDKARIFSVLSLESIVRKLTLDFRDIFSDGMFYKNITGDYHIKEGVLYTENTRMNGTAGNMYIKGNTSFVTNALDYHISYQPDLTSSLPVLAWIATLNPVVFLAGIAIDQVITSQVISEVNFELTGTVNEPIFKEVNRKSRDVSVGRSTPPEFVDNSSSNNLNVDDIKKQPLP